MVDHSGSQVPNRQRFFLVFTFVAFGQRLDVKGHGSLKAFHACQSQYVHYAMISIDKVPLCLSDISVSKDLKSSDTVVFSSPPIRSPAHCFKRPIRLLTFIVAGNDEIDGRRAAREQDL